MRFLELGLLAVALSMGCAVGSDDIDPEYGEEELDEDVDFRGGPLTFVMYGNSYSYFNGGIHLPLQRFAREAGFAIPNIYRQFPGNATFQTHVQSNTILNSIPSGTIDVMVAQGMSLECTSHPQYGNPSGAVANAVALVGQVLNHSPNLGQVVLYQTYARELGHSMYPSVWPDPPAMQAEVTQCYQNIADAIEQQHGVTTKIATIGEAFALGGFSDQWVDLYGTSSHPSRGSTIMVGQAIGTAAYGNLACPVPEPPEYATRPEAEGWRRMAGFADRVAPSQTQPHPGSLDDFILRSGVDAIETLCPMEDITAAGVLTLTMQTPLATLGGGAAVLFAEAIPVGKQLPGPMPGFPEVHFSTNAIAVWNSGALTSQPQSLSATIPGGLTSGDRILLQAVAVDAGVTSLTMSNAHVLTVP